MIEQQLAIYLRLSQEDKQKEEQEESNSISNQRKLILEFIHGKPEFSGYHIQEFCDDGYSGTNMNRPNIQKLLEEIKKNRISCIIVKDMSRFSRDYIELGTYLNQIFPFMGIRFLSINDHYDSQEHEGSTIEIDTAFQTLLYDLYSKDISMKTKASFQNKCEKGEYVFGQIPLGYEKSKERKNEIVVNEREAEIVRFIFALASNGTSNTQIARKLYEEKIPTAMQIRHPEREMKKNLTWDANMVRRILNHRFYLGEMVYGKSKRERVGSKKGIAVPKQEWNIISNHHEPLVTPEVFAQVSSFQPEKSTKRKGKKHPLIGKIFCGGCGYSLNYKKTSNDKKPRYFWCRKHAILQIADCCTYFNAAILEEMILLMLNQELIKRGNIEKEEKTLEEYQKTQQEVLKNRWEEKKKQYSHIWEERKKLYESYRLGEMTAEEYRNRADELKEKISFLEEDIQETEKEYEQRKEEYHQKKQDMKQIIRFLPMKELTEEMVDVFIKQINVYKGKRVEIEWNFVEKNVSWAQK